MSTVSTQSTPHPRAKITPAGKSPCEVARELRDQAPRWPPDGEWEGTWLGEGVGMDHGKGAGTTEPAPVGPAGDAGPIKPGPGGTKTVLRPYLKF